MTLQQDESVVYLRALCKAYQIGGAEVEVLKDVNINVVIGQFVAIRGPSDSGKTTLLNIISGIARSTSGQVVVLGQDLTVQDEDFLAEFRCNNVGFVFQSCFDFNGSGEHCVSNGMEPKT